MSENDPVSRRNLLRSVGVAAAATATSPVLSDSASAQAPASAPPAASPQAAAMPASAGYMYFRPAEAAFFEAIVEHMIPADGLTPGGVELGVATFIDRALASGYGKGDRLFMQGPWKLGTPNQGYQLPMTPADLFRNGVEQTNIHCTKTYGGKAFDALASTQKEEVLKGLEAGTIKFANGMPSKAFFDEMYQNVMQGMFGDPIYGGNRDKASWRMIGFPGVIATNQKNVATYKNKKFSVEPLSIADIS